MTDVDFLLSEIIELREKLEQAEKEIADLKQAIFDRANAALADAAEMRRLEQLLK